MDRLKSVVAVRARVFFQRAGLVLLVLLSCSWGFALPAPLESVQVQVKTEDGVILKGRRFPNEGKPKFVLIHGFSETWFIFAYLAPALRDQGFDVYTFNLRGHGNGEDRSVHPEFSPFEDTQDRVYSFVRMVQYDMAAIRRFIGPGPAFVLGHSKGGNVARYYNTGVRIYRGRPQVVPHNPEDMFDLVFKLGTPLHFQYDLKSYRLWAQSPQFIADWLATLTTSGHAPIEDGSVMTLDLLGLRSLCLDLAHRCVSPLLYRGLVDAQNLSASDRDLAQIFWQGFSRPPRDFAADIRFWKDHGFRLGDLELRGLPYPQPEKLIQIVGGRDALATREDALAEARERKQRGRVIEMGPFAHVDMVFGERARDWLVRRLTRTARQHLKLPTPQDCGALLVPESE